MLQQKKSPCDFVDSGTWVCNWRMKLGKIRRIEKGLIPNINTCRNVHRVGCDGIGRSLFLKRELALGVVGQGATKWWGLLKD